MTPDQIFSITNSTALIGWLALALFPRRRWTFVVAGVALPAIFAAIYIAIVMTRFFGADGSFSTLAGVSTLFSNPWILLAGWLHYLAFDLLTGTWEVRDAQRRGVPHLVVVPCLFLTLMFGPTGWLIYMIVRRAYAPAG
jgi:hypothetical protein